MYCGCTDTEPVNNSDKCNTSCSDFPLQTCGNIGGQVDSSLTSFSVYLANETGLSCPNISTIATTHSSSTMTGI